MESLWDRLSPPWRISLEEAWSAYCAGSVPIGAVVVDRRGKLLSRGRNRLHDSLEAGAYIHTSILAHAELNALLALPQEGVDPHVCCLYTTTEPCPLCMGAIYMSGVRQLCYASRDPWAGSVDMLGATPYLSRKPLRVFSPPDPNLEIILVAFNVDAVLRARVGRVEEVLEAWYEVVPMGVDFGRRIFQEGVLQRMEAAGENAAQVIASLQSMLT
jgi:tRNA(adenine34) deaminase